MKILKREKAITTVLRDNGEVWLCHRKKQRRDSRRRKKNARVIHEPLKLLYVLSDTRKHDANMSKLIQALETTDFTTCPKCGSTENFHYNYDYLKKDTPVIDVLCNECGEFFEPVKSQCDVQT